MSIAENDIPKIATGIMQYEVELKFPLQSSESVIGKLKTLGAVELPKVIQCDRYFNHPSRDFGITDEAFRIRSVDDNNCITYKGARADSLTKTRVEIEVPIAKGSEAANKMADIWRSLGFSFVREVHKSRTPFQLIWHQQEYDLALDDVPPLGQFLEIEVIADERDKDSARDSILALARELNLTNSERRSYLELLMATG